MFFNHSESVTELQICVCLVFMMLLIPWFYTLEITVKSIVNIFVSLETFSAERVKLIILMTPHMCTCQQLCFWVFPLFCCFILWDCLGTYPSFKLIWTQSCLVLLGQMNTFVGFDWRAVPDLWQFILAFICPHQYDVPWDCVSCPVNHRMAK